MTAVFTSTRQALHVSFLLEVMPATAKSQMQVVIEHHPLSRLALSGPETPLPTRLSPLWAYDPRAREERRPWADFSTS